MNSAAQKQKTHQTSSRCSSGKGTKEQKETFVSIVVKNFDSDLTGLERGAQVDLRPSHQRWAILYLNFSSVTHHIQLSSG